MAVMVAVILLAVLLVTMVPVPLLTLVMTVMVAVPVLAVMLMVVVPALVMLMVAVLMVLVPMPCLVPTQPVPPVSCGKTQSCPMAATRAARTLGMSPHMTAPCHWLLAVSASVGTTAMTVGTVSRLPSASAGTMGSCIRSAMPGGFSWWGVPRGTL